MKPLPLEEREFRKTLLRLERRVIIPLKWIVLLVTAGLWARLMDRPPELPVFLMFLAYCLVNTGQTWICYVSQVSLAQIKPMGLFSYLVDVCFVSALIYMDLATNVFGRVAHPEFYVLYFLLVMRGFALFKTVGETIFVNALISGLFILTIRLQRSDFSFLLQSDFTNTLVLVWLVILMSWFIVMVITQQKNELVKVHERLMRADSLSRVGELAAGVAHEINNPIGIIAATAEYLKLKVPPGGEVGEEIEAIRREAMRCKTILQEMLDYANPRSTGAALVDPREINDEVAQFVFGRDHGGTVRFEREYAADPGFVRVDANLFKQALLNLYMNARQAIPAGEPGVVIARVGPKKGRVEFEIEDNGVGLTPAELERAFEPFYTSKEQGTGLGLAIAQRIVEDFQGDIAVRPASGRGAVFTITLPRAQ